MCTTFELAVKVNDSNYNPKRKIRPLRKVRGMQPHKGLVPKVPSDSEHGTDRPLAQQGDAPKEKNKRNGRL
jgi:hypothetical protein